MIITTDRLVLRDFVEEDWPAVLAYQQDARYLQYYAWTGRSAEDVRAFVGMFLAQQQENPRIKFQLAATLKSSGQLIGNCGIRMAVAGARQAEIGFELDPRHWRQGYATEAAYAMMAFGFDQLNLHRIWAWCIADNVRSARVLERLGMAPEGRLRENECFKGRWWDTLTYAILVHEWSARQKEGSV